MFVDSVDFIVNTCDMKKKSLSTTERSSKVTPVVNFIPSKFWSLPQRVSRIVLHTDLNAYRESSGDSRFVTNFLLVFFKWSQTSSISCTNLTYPVTFIKVCAQYLFKITYNMMNWAKGKTYTQTLWQLEIWQKQPFDMKAMTPRGILGLCCVHIAQLMIHPAISKLPFTLQLY